MFCRSVEGAYSGEGRERVGGELTGGGDKGGWREGMRGRHCHYRGQTWRPVYVRVNGELKDSVYKWPA